MIGHPKSLGTTDWSDTLPRVLFTIIVFIIYVSFDK